MTKLKSMTMMFYDGYLQEQIIRNGTNKFLTNYRFCPKCWQEDKIPYIRKEHRIVFSTFCKKHKCYLQDKCPKCETPISAFKMFANELTYEFCSNCGFELANSEINDIRNEYRYKMNHKLFDVLDKGYIELENYYIYSFLFFDVIAQICRLILMNKKFNMSEKRILNYITKKKFSKAKSSFSQLSIKEQFILFSVIMNIFEEFPKRFELFILENKLSNFEMIRDMKNVSYWYKKSVNDILPNISYSVRMVTEEEILNGINYLRKRNVIVNQTNLTKLFGYNFFSSYNQLKKIFNNCWDAKNLASARIHTWPPDA